MRVFVSFSSDDRSQVEPIVEALRGAGHTVFYDQSNLPAGETYDQQIEEAVRNSDAMVYCLSPNSVRPGVYSLTELKFAREKWPSARNRVLPLIIGDLSFDDIPAYLKAVTVLRPDGNAAAETLSALSRMAVARKSPRRKWIAAGAAGALVIVGALLFWPRGGNHSIPPVSGEEIRPAPSLDVFDPRPTYEVSANYRNPDGEVHFFTGVELEFSPNVRGMLFETNLDEQEVELIPGRTIPFSGKLSFGGQPPESDARWRLGLSHESRTDYGEWRTWNPGAFTPSFEMLSPELAGRFAASTSTGQGIAGVYRDPPELILKNERVELSGLPVAINSFGGELAVAMLNPAAVSFFSSSDLVRKEQVPLPRLRNEFDEPISTSVSRLAFNRNHLWVATDSGSGSAGLLVYDRTRREWSVPPFDPFDTPDPEDLILKTSENGSIAGVASATIPTSVYLLTPEKLIVYGGHDFEDAGSATDFAWVGEDLLLRTGEGKIILCQLDGDRLLRMREGKTIVRAWESVHDRGDWPSYLIGGTFEACYLAINKRNSDGTRETEIVFATPDSTRTILHQPGSETLSLSVDDSHVVALLENQEQGRQIITLGE